MFNEAVSGFATGDVTIGGTSGGTKTGTVSGGPTTYSVSVTGMTTSGTVVATIAAGVAIDTAGNANAASTSTDNSVTWDSVAPTVTIDLNAASDSGVSNADNITNAANLVYTLTFSESVTGVTAADLTTTGSTATGCVIGNPTGSGATRSVTLTGCSNGSVVLNFLANGASDLAGNAGPASDVSLTVTVDRIAPTVTVNQAVGQVDPTNVSPIAFTVVFSETVAGFVTGDVTVGGTSGGTKTGTVSGGPITFNVAVTGMTTSGTVVATIAASRATDIAGNNNTASTSTDNTVTWDVTAPTVTINQAVGQVDPTGTSPITFTVVFNEAVSGFATGDVTIGGTSGGTKTGTVSGGPTTYSVSVTGMTTSGTVVATIAAGVATDTAGNANAASTSTDNSVTWDSVAPTVTIDLNAASDSGVSNADNITNAANLVYTLTFSESVTGVTAADLTTTGSTATGCVIGNPTGSGATRSVTLTGCSNGSVVLNFLANGASDLAGNAGPASDVSLTVTVDRIAPTVTVNQAVGQVDPTNVSPIAFTVVFSETVAGFITGDVTVGGTSGGTKTGTVSGGPITFNVAVTGMTTSGTVVATIAASRATDIAGNNNTASTSTDNTVTWDRATHVAFVQQPTDTVYGSTITPAVTVAILDASDQVVTESGASVTLTLAPSGPTLGGTVTVAAVNGVATFNDLTVDAVGTYTLGATSAGLTGATSAAFDITPAPLTITADDRTKTYGQTVVFAGTEFSVDRAAQCRHRRLGHAGQPGRGRDRHGGRQPVPDHALGGGRQRPRQLHHQLRPGEPHGHPGAADHHRRRPDQDVRPDGRLRGHRVLGRRAAQCRHRRLGHAGQPGRGRDRHGGRQPVPDHGLGGGRQRPRQLHHQLRPGEPHGHPGTADHHRRRPDQDVRPDGRLRGHRVLGRRAAQCRHRRLGHAGQPGRGRDRHGGRQPVPDHGLGGGRQRPRQLHHQLRPGEPHGRARRPDDRGDRLLGRLRRAPAHGHRHGDGRVRRGPVGRPRPVGDDPHAGRLLRRRVDLHGLDRQLPRRGRHRRQRDHARAADHHRRRPDQDLRPDRDVRRHRVRVAGLLGTDNVDSVTLASPGAPATATVAGSPYAIVASNAVGSGLANYSITYVDGSLTVDPAALTITADDQAKPFGVDFVFAGTEFSVTGLVNADTVDSATLSSPGAPAAAAPGTYPIDISVAVGSGLANYTIAYVDGALTVGNTAPSVGDADVTTDATVPVSGAVTVVDPDTGQTVTLSISSPPSHGTATVAADGTFSYTPAGTYTGHDAFTIEGCDDHAPSACDTGTVTVAVYPVAVDDDARIATDGGTVEVDVQANDIGDAGDVTIVAGPAHGSARVGSIIYTPDAGYDGTDQVVYRICSPNDPRTVR